jgi:hypothetical protein
MDKRMHLCVCMYGWMDACMHQPMDRLNTCVNGFVDV